MEFNLSKRNVIVSIVLTILAFIASYFACKPESAYVAESINLAVYGGIIGATIGAVGEFINFLMQKPKNTSWLGILGSVIVGVIASFIV